MMSRQLVPALLVLLAATIGGPASAQESVNASPDVDPALGIAEYRIGPEDVLEISVWNNASLSRTVNVRPDGKISLPLLNDVPAAGLTPAGLGELLAERLLEYMPAPKVAVIVKDIKSFRVSVIGEVRTTGRIELKSWTTVLDVLALAGGFTQFAARSRIVVFRREGNTMKQIPFNYNKLIGAGLLNKIVRSGDGEQENFYLRPGDIVLVP